MSNAPTNAQLGRSVVKTGDIMIKHSTGDVVSTIIRIGQLFGRGTSKYVHAGIASSSTTIIEMGKEGLTENDLLTANSTYTYDVFRCRYPLIADGAAETAQMMYDGVKAFIASRGNGMNISYSFAGAARSISKRAGWDGSDVVNIALDSLLQADGSAFFCSGHVVLCYQSAMGQHQIQGTLPAQQAQQIFGLKDSCYQPAYLHKKLSESLHFNRVGTVRGTQRV